MLTCAIFISQTVIYMQKGQGRAHTELGAKNHCVCLYLGMHTLVVTSTNNINNPQICIVYICKYCING